jgi:calcium/proton exchanger cax
MGVVLIPVVGNVSEILVGGVRTARANKLDLSLSIATTSAMQIALFVSPLLAIINPYFGQELTLYFSIFEVFALALAVFFRSGNSQRWGLQLDGRGAVSSAISHPCVMVLLPGSYSNVA